MATVTRFFFVRLLVAGAVIGLLGFASFWTIRLGLADRWFNSGSDGAAQRARWLSPQDATYFNADLGDRSALERARILNPRSGATCIRLGLHSELNGDTIRAEQLLLDAAKVDRTYEPRWTLANFYFRRAQWDRFWFWAREALQIAYNDQSPLYLLCWRATQDPALILQRAIPDRASILADYLNFLILQGKLDAAEPVGNRFIAHASQESLPLLFAYCNRLLETRRPQTALKVWNALCTRRIIPKNPLVPEEGKSLTNGDFSSIPVSAGFDWRLNRAIGVSVVRGATPRELRVTLSGSQQESCLAVEQIVPLVPSRSYRLRYSYRSEGVNLDSGLRWRVSNFNGDNTWASSPTALADDQWTDGTLTFLTPADGNLGRITLRCDRIAGTTRVEGSLWLREVRLGFE